jgi:phenylalanyl-tRNA synthetase beta chain
MLISLHWINELVTTEGQTPLDETDVAVALTELGLEVEATTRVGGGLEAIVVGEVRAKEAHPNADRLTAVTLFDGAEEIPVVCGATNLPEVGGKVAFAPVGTTLPNGLKIAAREVRGATSRGMICSEVELEIGPDGDGILILNATWSAGERLLDRVPGLQDVVFEIGVTPNRPDALGHVGVARDLGVRWSRTVRKDRLQGVEEWARVPVDAGLVQLEAPAACGRYRGFALESLAVRASPLWMRTRLHRVGLRPINNVVDVTNYVLAEYGQPQHVFDRDHLDGGAVVIRSARSDETMVTLDDSTLTLGASDLVIADASRPQALAGVMGGATSMVTDGSTRGLLEIAWFEPSGVRTSAKRHGLHTDSSHRFERQVDHGALLDAAAARALTLLQTLAGASVVGRCDVRGELPSAVEIRLRHSRLEGLLGVSVPPAEVSRILLGLGVECVVTGAGNTSVYLCVPPSFRPDLSLEVDLIEEVMRHVGLDAVPVDPVASTGAAAGALREPMYARAHALVDAFRELGFHEHIGFAFTGARELELLGGAAAVERAVQVANPLRSQHAFMRQSLLPSLLDAGALNRSRHGRHVALFELGRTYAWSDAPGAGSSVTAEIDRSLPTERLALSAVFVPSKQGPSTGARALVKVGLDALKRIGCTARTRPPEALDPHLHPGVQVALQASDGAGEWQVVGSVGELHPEICRAWDLPDSGRIFCVTLDVHAVPRADRGRHVPLPRFPSTSRDISIELPVHVPVSAAIEAFANVASARGTAAPDQPQISASDASGAEIEALEDYRGDGVPVGRKAMLFRLSYRAEARSVTDDEVQPLHEEIVAATILEFESKGWAPIRR